MDSLIFLCKNYKSALLIALPNMGFSFLYFIFLEHPMPFYSGLFFILPVTRDILFTFSALAWMRLFITGGGQAYSFLKSISIFKILVLGLLWSFALKIFDLIFAFFLFIFSSALLSLMLFLGQNTAPEADPFTDFLSVIDPIISLFPFLSVCLLSYIKFYVFFSPGLIMAALADEKEISFWKADYLATAMKHRFSLAALLTCSLLAVWFALSNLNVWPAWPEALVYVYAGFFVPAFMLILALIDSLQLFLCAGCTTIYYQWALRHRNVDFESP